MGGSYCFADALHPLLAAFVDRGSERTGKPANRAGGNNTQIESAALSEGKLFRAAFEAAEVLVAFTSYIRDMPISGKKTWGTVLQISLG